MKTTPRQARKRRHARVRANVKGTASRPRLCVFRSLVHTHAQVIDDLSGHTLAAASTLDPDLKAQAQGKTKTRAAQLVGELIAKRALERGITQVVFDRAGYKYHGRVKAVAEAARAAGLIF